MDEVRRQLAEYLLPDELLLWVGRPDPAKHLGPSDVFLIPFSLLWCGFALLWMGAALVSGAPWHFVLFGLPFVVMGLYFVIGRFVLKARRKRQTVYGLTDRRAIVAIGAGAMSDAPVERQPVARTRSRDGKHVTVMFGRPATGWLSGPNYANTGMELLQQGSSQFGFYDVADVNGLETALQRLRS